MEVNKNTREEAIEWYISNETTYKKLSKKVENIIVELFNLNNVDYHIVNSRAKEIESFRKKINDEKYDDPINQIKDLSGIRIITYVEDEVKDVCKIIEDTFDIDKDHSLDKSDELGIDKVGYKSVHYVAKLKDDRLKLPEYKIYKDKYFEIQVRTILQHAWAEIEHDRNYKFSGKLPDEISRRFKLLAGLLEVSDREFNNISKEIDVISKEVEIGVKKGKLKFDVNSTSLNQFLETRFKELPEAGFKMIPNIERKVINELKEYGITSLEQFDKIIPKDLIKILINNVNELNGEIRYTGLIRTIMIANNSELYFSKSWNNNWKIWSSDKSFTNIFEHYKVDTNKIEKDYDVKFTP